jgi:hypothetical protein
MHNSPGQHGWIHPTMPMVGCLALARILPLMPMRGRISYSLGNYVATPVTRLTLSCQKRAGLEK